MLELEAVAKRTGGRDVLSDINVSIRPGCLAVIGPNGAGKTTLLRLTAGLAQPTAGRVTFAGLDVYRDPARYRDNVGYKPQDVTVYAHEPSRAMLTYFGRLKAIPTDLLKSRVEWAIEAFGLEAVVDRPLASLSRGYRQRFFLAVAMLNDPDILVLDEPVQGLDDLGRLEFYRLIAALSRDRVVVVSTHLVEDIAPIASRVLVLAGGRTCLLGGVGDLAAAAGGLVWEVAVTGASPGLALRELRLDHTVTGIRPRDDGGWLVRLIASRQPHPQAHQVPPTAEEGYLAAVGLTAVAAQKSS